MVCPAPRLPKRFRETTMGRKALRFALAALLLLPVAAVAQSTVGLTGNFSDISGGVTPGLQIQFLLAGCGGNLPRVVGHFGIVNSQYNFTPDPTTGLLTGNIWPNDVITCGLVTGSTQYLVSFLVNNIPQGPATCFQITSSENPFDLTSQTPCNQTSVPPPPTPPFDGVFHNLNVTGFFSGTNGSMSGSFTAGSFHFAATPAPCPSGQYSTGLNINFGPTCLPLPTAPTVVTSFNTRQNAVLPQTGDYTCPQITGAICSLPTLTVFGRSLPVTAASGDYTCSQVTGAACGGTDTATTCNSNGCFFEKPDGTLVEWGTAAGCTTSSGGPCLVTVTFPQAFTSTTNLVPIANCSGGLTNCLAASSSILTTGFTAQLTAVVRVSGSGSNLDGTESVMWNAFGH